MEGVVTAGPSLIELLATIPGPRRARGRIHPLPAVLSLAAVAMLAGMKGLGAIAQFGRGRGAGLAHASGFRRNKTPAKSPLSGIFRATDLDAFAAALRARVQGHSAAGDAGALEGRPLKGSRAGGVPGVHLLAACAPAGVAVLGQLRVDAKTNAHKAALQLLGIIPVPGTGVSGAARSTHRAFAQGVRDRGGDYLLPVKDNPPEPEARTQAALHDDAASSPDQRRRTGAAEEEARTAAKGHGRRGCRRLSSTTVVGDYLDWPEVGPVFEVERVRVTGTRPPAEVVYGIARVGRERADAAALLRLARNHWGIENGWQ